MMENSTYPETTVFIVSKRYGPLDYDTIGSDISSMFHKISPNNIYIERLSDAVFVIAVIDMDNIDVLEGCAVENFLAENGWTIIQRHEV